MPCCGARRTGEFAFRSTLRSGARLYAKLREAVIKNWPMPMFPVCLHAAASAGVFCHPRPGRPAAPCCSGIIAEPHGARSAPSTSPSGLACIYLPVVGVSGDQETVQWTVSASERATRCPASSSGASPLPSGTTGRGVRNARKTVQWTVFSDERAEPAGRWARRSRPAPRRTADSSLSSSHVVGMARRPN